MRRLVLVLFLALPSCTVYRPLPLDPPPPAGTQVHARLTTPGAVRMSDLFGRPLLGLDGTLLRVGADSLQVALISATEYGRPWEAVDTVSLGRPEVAALEEKRIDATRTALLTGGVAIAGGAVIVSLFRAATRSADSGRTEPPDVILIPVFSYIH